MKRLILRLIIAFLTFVFSYAVTWVTARFSDEPAPNQIKAFRHMQTIGTAQLEYMATRGKEEFADLETLGREGLLDKQLASGENDGYIFTLKPGQISPKVAMFDLIARPASSAGKALTLYSNESFVIYEITDLEASPVSSQERIPKNGIPVQ
jgi:hypothetical protein